MTSVFKQAATQSRTSVLIQSLPITESAVFKVSRLGLGPKFGKNKSEWKPFSRITTNSAKVTASTTSSSLDFQQLSVSWICILMLKRWKPSRISTGWNPAISSSTLSLLPILMNNSVTLRWPRPIFPFWRKMGEWGMTRANCSRSWTTLGGPSRAREYLSNLLFRTTTGPRATSSLESNLSEFWTTSVWSKTKNLLTCYQESTPEAATKRRYAIRNLSRTLRMWMRCNLWRLKGWCPIHQLLTPTKTSRWIFTKILLLKNSTSRRGCLKDVSLSRNCWRKSKLRLLWKDWE